MAGVWKKVGTYLGLVEDEELEDYEEPLEAAGGGGIQPRTARVRSAEAVPDRPEAVVRTMSTVRPPALASIHRAEPKRFNDVRDIGERFKQGVAVIMNLQGTEDYVARRVVDFASGLVFGLEGSIEMVATRVYLMTPANLEVSAEDRERLVDGSFFNQF
jgi:cell division inhibitor SepF